MKYWLLKSEPDVWAINQLKKSGVNCDIIDLRTISPMDLESIYKSVKKTGRLLTLDTGFSNCSVAGEIIAKVTEAQVKKFVKSEVKKQLTEHFQVNKFENTNMEKHSENLIEQGCHGTVIFGSTGQAQLIPISENNCSNSLIFPML